MNIIEAIYRNTKDKVVHKDSDGIVTTYLIGELANHLKLGGVPISWEGREWEVVLDPYEAWAVLDATGCLVKMSPNRQGAEEYLKRRYTDGRIAHMKEVVP